MSKNLIVESEYASGIAYSNERRYYAPIALTEKESYSDGERGVIAYEVPEGTTLYELSKEQIYEESFSWTLGKYDWNVGAWKRMDGASAVCDDPDYSVIKPAYYGTTVWLEKAGFICH